MKKTFAVLTMGALSFAISAQKAVTNKIGSSYRFEEMAHLDATPVQSQGWTGTCWSFSALSFFETELDRMGKNMPILSEMFIVYQAYLGKAEKYYRTDGNTNFDEGGAFHDIPWVISRFGVVPKSIYSGLNYGSKKHNHAEMFKVLKGAMDGLMKARRNVDDGKGMTATWQSAIRGILNAYLGEIPENVEDWKFNVEGKKYNPISYRDKLGLNMDDYVSLTSFSNHPWNKECHLAIADNWAWGTSYNVKLEDLWAAAEYAITEGYSFAWGADVSEKYFSFQSGLAIVPKDKETIFAEGKDNKNFSDAGSEKKASCFLEPGEEETITQEYRQAGYDAKRTTDDHGMHAVGLYRDQKGTKYLLIKNSWGTDYNDCDGYFYASKAYFEYKTINIYLHKDGLSREMKKRLNVN